LPAVLTTDHQAGQSDRLVTVTVAAELTRIPARTIRRWLEHGQLVTVASNRGRLVNLDAVREMAITTGHPVALQWLMASHADQLGHDDHLTDDSGHIDGHHGQLAGQDGRVPADTVAVSSADFLTVIERQQQTILELSGRLGFYQSEIQHLKARILELEAPKEPVAAAASGVTVMATGDVPMEYQDCDLTCVDCGQVFLLTAGERVFYIKRGLVEPKRCPICRRTRRQQRKQVRADHGPAEMSNYSGSEQNGRDVSAQAASEEPTKQPQAEAVSGASAPSVTSSQETSSGGVFKRFWCWLTQPG
jgi:hypothetical protein